MLDKDTNICIRVSTEELKTIRERAYEQGMSVSQYIRTMCANAQLQKVMKERETEK